MVVLLVVLWDSFGLPSRHPEEAFLLSFGLVLVPERLLQLGEAVPARIRAGDV